MTESPDILDRLAGVFRSEDIFLIATHRNPDGDGVGSMLGLAMVLEALGKKVTCYCENPVPKHLAFLPGRSRIKSELNPESPYRVVVALDCGEKDRLGEATRMMRKAEVVVNLDHHVSSKPFGDLNMVDTGVSSTAELLMRVFERMEARIPHEAAVNLYTGIMTDTGSFRFDNTTPETFRVAARLVESGVNPWEIYRACYHSYTPGRLRLLARVLATFRTELEGRVGMLRAEEGMHRATGTTHADLEGFVDMPRMVREIEVSVLISPREEGIISVSFRSSGLVDVAAIAEKHGGGGHSSAAAFQSRKSFEELESLVLGELSRALEEV